MPDIYDMTGPEFVAWVLNQYDPTFNCTPEEIERSGYGYAFTPLTDEEAERLGAKAYIRRRA